MKGSRATVYAFVLTIAAAGLTACDGGDGAFEQSGERIDRGLDNARDSMEDAGDRAGDAVDEAGDRLRDFGDGNQGSGAGDGTGQ